jgi:hypothetical protein
MSSPDPSSTIVARSEGYTYPRGSLGVVPRSRAFSRNPHRPCQPARRVLDHHNVTKKPTKKAAPKAASKKAKAAAAGAKEEPKPRARRGGAAR